MQRKTEIDINGEQVDYVNHFENIGATVQGDSKKSLAIIRKIAETKLETVWEGQNTPKGRMFKTGVILTDLHGSEPWTVNRRHYKNTSY